MQAFRTKISNDEFQGYEYGDPKKPALVCLHGMTGDSNSFLELIDLLKNDFRLILIDAPGHGESDPFEREEDYKFSSIAKLIHQVVEKKTDEAYYILGHSWGAELALHIAKLFPEIIEGLILLDGGYLFPEHVEGMTEEKALAGWADYIDSSRYTSWEDVVSAYQEYTTRPWNQTLDSIIASNFKRGNDPYILKADKFSLLATIKAFYQEPCSTTYKNIKCPVLLFHATVPEWDPSRDQGVDKIKNDMDSIKVIGIKNTKHNLHWDCPDKVANDILVWKQGL